MKLSIFTTVTFPEERQDPFKEAMASYSDLADEVVVVDGDDKNDDYVSFDGNLKIIRHKWEHDFDWKFIGEQFQRGYEACTGDWVIHADIDYIFHENDMELIRKTLEESPDDLAFSFFKYQFILVDRYNLKSRCVLAVNKKKYKNIKFNGGGDLCQPTVNGKLINANQVKPMGVPFYNYDFSFKELPVIEKDWKRFRRAWNNHFDKDMGEFKDMMVGRYKGRSWEKIRLEDHPKYIQERIKNIKPNQCGHSLFGWVEDRAYDK